jgi:CO/xanthine dehydrogenase Mo-binding subunit
MVVETPQPDGPFGARGVGEHSMISVAAALGNAIQDATLDRADAKSAGAQLTHMPIRYEDVWRALRDKEAIDNWITKTPFGSCRSVPEVR